MGRTRNKTLFGKIHYNLTTLLLTFLFITTPLLTSKTYAAYSEVDLSGTWDLTVTFIDDAITSMGYSTGPGTLNGTFSVTNVENDGSTGSVTITSSATIFSDGKVSIHFSYPGDAFTFDGYMNSSKDTIVSVHYNSAGEYITALLTKRAASYSASDLTGTWDLNSRYIGSAFDFIGYSTGSGELNGSFSITDVESVNGVVSTESSSISSAASIINEGKVTITFSDSIDSFIFEGYMDASKDTIVSVNNFDDAFNSIVLTKKATTYNASDLDGAWDIQVAFIDSSYEFIGCSKGTGALIGTFDITDIETDSGGTSTETSTITSSATIASNGKVTITISDSIGDFTFDGDMNSSKDMIVSLSHGEGEINTIFLTKKDIATLTKGIPAFLLLLND